MTDKMPLPLYNVGDIIRLKSLQQLRQDLGTPIRAQCGWAVPMNEYAGGEYEVMSCESFASNGFHYSYRLRGAGGYLYSEDTIDHAAFEKLNTVSICDVRMLYDDLMSGNSMPDVQ